MVVQKAWRAAAVLMQWVLWVVGMALLWLWVACVFDATIRWGLTGRWPVNAPSVLYTRSMAQSSNLSPWLAAAFVAALAAVACLVTRRLSLARRFLITAAGVVVLLATGWLLLSLDPGGIVGWALD